MLSAGRKRRAAQRSGIPRVTKYGPPGCVKVKHPFVFTARFQLRLFGKLLCKYFTSLAVLVVNLKPPFKARVGRARRNTSCYEPAIVTGTVEECAGVPTRELGTRAMKTSWIFSR
ncbi:hypothetical protein EVAR_20639_1 [Eumeta japonica]|uniref:Uncharacterized protein n=1 Tax=Eumeta variegata TaxID=151549 RepID=A0A4C1VDT4_EUMVA|nr:hypothetical protein EVAR_20639_1 [Eumeta japonica]